MPSFEKKKISSFLLQSGAVVSTNAVYAYVEEKNRYTHTNMSIVWPEYCMLINNILFFY